MKHSYLVEENHRNPAPFSLTDLCTESREQGLDVPPGDVRAGWVAVDRGQSAVVRAFHGETVLQDGTEHNGRRFVKPRQDGFVSKGGPSPAP